MTPAEVMAVAKRLFALQAAMLCCYQRLIGRVWDEVPPLEDLALARAWLDAAEGVEDAA